MENFIFRAAPRLILRLRTRDGIKMVVFKNCCLGILYYFSSAFFVGLCFVLLSNQQWSWKPLKKSEISKFVILSVAKNPINKGKDSSALPQNDRSFYFFSGF